MVMLLLCLKIEIDCGKDLHGYDQYGKSAGIS